MFNCKYFVINDDKIFLVHIVDLILFIHIQVPVSLAVDSRL